MPGQNGTGPMGQGAGTGRGMGPCAMPTGRQGAGMGYGRRGGGRGLGFRRFWGYYPTTAPSKQEEKEILAQDAQMMEEELRSIKARLAELESEK